MVTKFRVITFNKVNIYIVNCSAQGPFNFDVDPDPGSALEKMDPNPDSDPGHFLKIY